jgi:hypothetical protein
MVFSSTYEIYKQGTSQVITWLGKTAAQCGYEAFAATGTAPSQKSPKKKAPKSKQKSSSNAQSKSINHTISTNQLPVLATFISEHFKDVSDFKALPGILEVLKDVISRRKEWGKNFKIPDPAAAASNERHKHFVTVLEEVHQILGGVMNALHISTLKSSANAVEDGKLSDEKALTNIFAILDIEESVDQEETVTVPSQGPSSAPTTTVTYELEDEVDEEEIYFSIYCFFKDFQDLRPQISQSWADYISGILDLAAVAVTTNVYLEMLQRAETKLLASIPKKFKLFDYEKITLLFQKTIAITRDVDPAFRQQKGDLINMDLRDVADFTCLPTYIFLSSFLPVIQGSIAPVMKPGFFGDVDLSGQPLSWRDTVNQDKIVLLELFPEYCILNQIRNELPVQDELSRGLREMMRTKKIPMWLVLGCRIYLDIHHTMLSNIGKAHKDLQTEGLHVSKTLQEYADFSKDMSIENWPKQNDKVLQMIKLEADLWVNKDTIAVAQKKVFNSAGLSEEYMKPYSLLSRQPLLCGLMLFRLNLLMQEAGTTLVNAWGSLPSTLHLYNALKHECPPATFHPWQDLDALIRIQSPQRIFVGDCPTTTAEYIKRFCLVMGYSAAMLAPNRRGGRNTPQTQTPASMRGPRQMTATSAVADVFLDQYGAPFGASKAEPEVTFAKIETLLDEVRGGAVKTSNNRKNKLPPLTTAAFLSALRDALQADILALNVDYFALHIRSVDLLRDIYVKLDADFLKYLGPRYIEKESELPFLVGYLFGIASQSGKAAEELRLAGRDDVVTSAILLKAGELVGEVVAKEGSTELDRVRKVCPGFEWLE